MPAEQSRMARRRQERRRRVLTRLVAPLAVVVVLIAVVVVVVHHSHAAAQSRTAAASAHASATRRATTTTPPHATTAPHATTTTVPPTTTTTDQPGWTVVSRVGSAIAVDEKTVNLPDGVNVTLLRFHADAVQYILHAGSQDPPVGNASIPAQSLPSIDAAQQAQLLAAFNGGFKVDAGAGGTEIAGQVLTPLQPGLASLVIDSAGHASIGVWGQNEPPKGAQVVDVRQNLPLLVQNGQVVPTASNVADWGLTVGGVSAVARSALGEDSAGNLIYAGSAGALPIDMGNALVAGGAVTGMELDINPDWVQADVTPAPGGPLTAAIPGQYPPADQYISGWTRDFVTVVAGS